MLINLTMAISDYAHTRDLVTGRVTPEGIKLNILSYPFEQVGLRFAMNKEFDISEFSFAGYCAHVANGGMQDMVGIPIFPSRVFRQSGFFVNCDAGIKTVGDLKGKRIGIPQWSQTATVYARGYLQHHAGVPLDSVEWVRAGVNSPGRKESVELNLPKSIKLKSLPAHTLSDMLVSGEIDAVISARTPNCFIDKNPMVRRLFDDPMQAERDYFNQSGIFPIMHVIVVRRDIYDANRWILHNLMEAFEKAKQNALNRLYDGTTSYLPIPWGTEVVANLQAEVFGDGEIWPYGVDLNRKTLDPFLLYCFEQGVTRKHLTVEDLFPAECNQQVIV